MGFILYPSEDGEEVYINAWHWRCTLEILRRASLLDAETLELAGMQFLRPIAAQQADRIGAYLNTYLAVLTPDARILYDGTVINESVAVEHDPDDMRWTYSTNYAWLTEFRDFCLRSGGFKVG
jgi:hypothetical protein